MVPQFSRRSLTILHQDLVHVRVVALETALRWNEALFGTVTVSSDHDLLEHIHGIHGFPRVQCFFNVQYPTCFNLSMRNGIRNVFFDGQNSMETTSVQYVILLKNNNEYSTWKAKNCVHTFPVVSKSSSQKYQKKTCSTLFYLKFSRLFPSLPMDFDRRATQLALVLLKALDQGINQRLGTKGRRTSYGQFEYSNIYIYIRIAIQ